jgi:hypothetical protein
LVIFQASHVDRGAIITRTKIPEPYATILAHNGSRATAAHSVNSVFAIPVATASTLVASVAFTRRLQFIL